MNVVIFKSIYKKYFPHVQFACIICSEEVYYILFEWIFCFDTFEKFLLPNLATKWFGWVW